MNNFVKIFLTTGVLLLAIYSSAQSNWEHHVAIGESQEVEVYENIAYVATTSGLLIIDLETGAEELLHPGNSDLTEFGIKEVEVKSNGHLWLTTSDNLKLFYYDGEKITQHLDTIPYILNLRAIDDVLWFLSIDVVGIFLYSIEDGLLISHGEFNSVQMEGGSNGQMWAVTTDHIIKYDRNNQNDTIALPQLDGILNHFVDSQNRLWLSTISSNAPIIFKYEDNEWTAIPALDYIFKFYEHSPGQIEGTDLGSKVFRINDDTIEEDLISEIFPGVPFRVDLLLFENAESLWYKTETAFTSYQFFRATPDTIYEYGINEDFMASPISDITLDCDGNLLCLDARFLQKETAEGWDTIARGRKNEDCSFNNFVTDKFGCEVWFSGRETGCQSLWQLQGDSLLDIDILPQFTFYLERDSLGNFYFPTTSPTRIGKINDVGATSYTHLPDAVSTLGFLVAEDQKIYTIERNSINEYQPIVIQDGTRIEIDLSIPVLSEISLSYLIFEDSQHNIWYQERQGLIKYDGESAEFFPMGFEISHSDRRDMVEDKNGNFWIATRKNGVIRWRPTSTRTYTTFNSDILSNSCHDLEIVDDQLWINHEFGLTKMKIDDFGTATKELEEKLDTKPLQYVLYPNPSHGLITIANPQLQNRKIEIFTMSGALVSSHISADLEWSTTLGAGVYWVRLNENGHESIEKLVIID